MHEASLGAAAMCRLYRSGCTGSELKGHELKSAGDSAGLHVTPHVTRGRPSPQRVEQTLLSVRRRSIVKACVDVGVSGPLVSLELPPTRWRPSICVVIPALVAANEVRRAR